jgi:Mrp family chromosome partitioning ATPase
LSAVLFLTGTFSTGLRVLGVVENMSDIRLPFQSLVSPSSGISLVNKLGEDVTAQMLER